MKLPIQAPPVARNSTAARPGLASTASVSALSTETTATGSTAAGSSASGDPGTSGGAILPQADCVCRDTGGGQYRLFCRIGRNYYNTGRVCKP